jgi:hypothetical protein
MSSNKAVKQHFANNGDQIVRTLAIRLWQIAMKLSRINAAIKRATDYNCDPDYSPSKYTPSQNDSRKDRENTFTILEGYCLAIDDILNRDHGTTNELWWQAFDKKLHMPKPTDDVFDHDSSYQATSNTEMAAVDAFEKYIFHNPERYE